MSLYVHELKHVNYIDIIQYLIDNHLTVSQAKEAYGWLLPSPNSSSFDQSKRSSKNEKRQATNKPLGIFMTSLGSFVIPGTTFIKSFKVRVCTGNVHRFIASKPCPHLIASSFHCRCHAYHVERHIGVLRCCAESWLLDLE